MSKNLVTLIADWSEGSLDDETLLRAFDSAQESIRGHQEGFGLSVEALEPKQSDHCEPLIDFAMQLLDDLNDHVEQGRLAINQGQRNALFIAGDQIRRDSFQLNQAFLEFRNQALLSLGPTGIPNLNLLLSLQKKFQENPSATAKAQLIKALETEILMNQASLERAEAEDPDIDLLPTLKRVFEEQQSCLKGFVAALQRDEDIDFFPYILELQATYSEIQRLLPSIARSQQVKGETDFSDLNLLIRLLRDVSAGAVGDEPLIEVLESVEESFPKFLEVLEKRQSSESSALVKDEIDKALDSFADFEEGIESVYGFFESRDVSALSVAQEHFLGFASVLSEALANIGSPSQSESQDTCLMCGAPKQPGAVRCPKCRAPIISLAQSPTSQVVAQESAPPSPQENESLLVTEQLARVYGAVDKIAADRMGDEEFLAEIHRFENHMKTSLDDLPPLAERPDPNTQRQYEHFQAAIMNIGSGTNLLKKFVAERDQDLLKEGVLSIDRGARVLSRLGEGHR